MRAVDPRVATALREQLGAWRDRLAAGGERVGWKIGFNIPEIQRRLGIDEPVVGHLTSLTAIDGTFDGAAAEALRAEAEVAIEVGDRLRYAPAIEIVDVGRPPGGVEAIVATNIFHRGFLVGDFRDEPSDGGEGRLLVNGELRERGAVEVDASGTIELVRRHLASAGEELRDGDVIIAGAFAHTAVERGDRVEAEFSDLGRLAVEIT